jgi:hypothetical protein
MAEPFSFLIKGHCWIALCFIDPRFNRPFRGMKATVMERRLQNNRYWQSDPGCDAWFVPNHERVTIIRGKG